MGNLKSNAKKARSRASKASRAPAERSIADIHREFCDHLKDLSVVDPQGRTITFRIENFPYLIKMEYFHGAHGKWVGAKASAVNQALLEGTFDETAHRCDHARARGLRRIPQILKEPDSIHENIHPRVNGELVYVTRSSGGSIKIVTVTRNHRREWVLVTSFYTSERYLRTCAKEPPLYRK